MEAAKPESVNWAAKPRTDKAKSGPARSSREKLTVAARRDIGFVNMPLAYVIHEAGENSRAGKVVNIMVTRRSPAFLSLIVLGQRLAESLL